MQCEVRCSMRLRRKKSQEGRDKRDKHSLLQEKQLLKHIAVHKQPFQQVRYDYCGTAVLYSEHRKAKIPLPDISL